MPPKPIPRGLLATGYFIFLGKLQPINRIDYEAILSDFDRLLPLYLFVESGGKPKVAPLNRNARWRRKAAVVSSVEDQERRMRARKIEARQTHHRIRNKLYEHLREQHPNAVVEIERDFVDVRVSESNRIILYEVKTYQNVSQCVREALGQALLYAWRDITNKFQKIKLIVVGPSSPTKEDQEFIGFVTRHVRIDFDYLPHL
jgi:hypothetical protein